MYIGALLNTTVVGASLVGGAQVILVYSIGIRTYPVGMPTASWGNVHIHTKAYLILAFFFGGFPWLFNKEPMALRIREWMLICRPGLTTAHQSTAKPFVRRKYPC